MKTTKPTEHSEADTDESQADILPEASNEQPERPERMYLSTRKAIARLLLESDNQRFAVSPVLSKSDCTKHDVVYLPAKVIGTNPAFLQKMIRRYEGQLWQQAKQIKGQIYSYEWLISKEEFLKWYPSEINQAEAQAETGEHQIKYRFSAAERQAMLSRMGQESQVVVAALWSLTQGGSFHLARRGDNPADSFYVDFNQVGAKSKSAFQSLIYRINGYLINKIHEAGRQRGYCYRWIVSDNQIQKWFKEYFPTAEKPTATVEVQHLEQTPVEPLTTPGKQGDVESLKKRISELEEEISLADQVFALVLHMKKYDATVVAEAYEKWQKFTS